MTEPAPDWLKQLANDHLMKVVEGGQAERPVGMSNHWGHGYASGFGKGFEMGFEVAMAAIRQLTPPPKLSEFPKVRDFLRPSQSRAESTDRGDGEMPRNKSGS